MALSSWLPSIRVSAPEGLAAVAFIAVGLYIATVGNKNKEWTLFGVGGLLGYSLAASILMPNLFGTENHPHTVLAVLGDVLAIFMAFAGGSVALLWEEVASSLSGGLVALVLTLLVVGTFKLTPPLWLATLLFLFVSAASLIVLLRMDSKKLRTASSALSTALLGSLLVVCGVDILFSEGFLFKDLGALFSARYADIGGENGNIVCDPLYNLAFWALLSLVTIGVQHKCNSDLHIWQDLKNCLCNSGYVSVPGGDGGPADARRAAAGRTTVHTRGDSNIFHNSSNRPVNVVDLRLSGDEQPGQGQAPQGSPNSAVSGASSVSAVTGADPEEKAMVGVLAGMLDHITDVFGFQNESARNQVEHLVLLLIQQKRYQEASYQKLLPNGRAPFSGEGGPVDILHAKLFGNYKRWATALKVKTVFDTHPELQPKEGQSQPRATASSKNDRDKPWYDTAKAKHKMHNILIWLLIWGEAGNLRHMPECLAFLYHKMAIHFKECVGKNISARIQGHFLHNTVAPIYQVVQAEFKKHATTDHGGLRNYDDFNEFFWTRDCLQCAWTDGDEAESVTPADLEAGGGAGAGGEKRQTVAAALKTRPKTFVETRTWLHIMLTFHRLVDWHVLTFHFMAMIAFWELLCWDLPYFCQMLSSVFLTMNLLGIVWSMLEVWDGAQDDRNPCPKFRRTTEERWGLSLRILTRVAFLWQQIHFFGLSLQHGALDLKPDEQLAEKNLQLAYWWNYVWISIMLNSVGIVDCLLQVVPRASTYIFESQRPYLRAFLDITFPQSRNYTGKRVHEHFGKVMLYAAFWAFVLVVKLKFSYFNEVRAVALPTLELADDYVNFLDQNIVRTSVLIGARWVPFVLIYLLDMIIIYSIFAGMMGLLVGVIEKLGQVKSFVDVRGMFMKAPEHFFSRLVFNYDDNAIKHKREASIVSDLRMTRRFTGSRNDLLANAEEGRPLIAPSTPVTPVTGPAGNATALMRNYHSLSSGGEAFLDISTSKWRALATAWNRVVQNLRQTDEISNDERDMLLFHFFDDMSKAIYLPVFQTAGAVEKAVTVCEEKGRQFRAVVEKGDKDYDKRRKDAEGQLWKQLREDGTMFEAVSEVMELGLYVLTKLLGEQSQADMEKIKVTLEALQAEAQEEGGDADVEEGRGGSRGKAMLLDSLKLEDVKKVANGLAALIGALKGQLPKRKPNSKRVRPAKAAAQAKPQEGLVKVGSTMKKSRSAGFLGSLSSQDLLGADPAAASGTDGAQEELDSLRDRVQGEVRNFFSSVKGMIINGGNRHLSNVAESISNILDSEKSFIWDEFYAATTLDTLASPENKRQLLPILAKLHGLLTLHVAQAEPRSMEARRRLSFFVNSLFMDLPKAPSIQQMMSWTVVTPYYNEDVLYNRKDLESMPSTEGVTTLLYLQTLYANDWKNFLERLGLKDESKIWDSPYNEEVRIWTSMRAQTLTRTVQGMMYYEEALKILSELDRNPMGPAEGQAVEETIKRKFSYVVSCQIYGKLKKQQDSKATDIEFLLQRFPNMRVAYIDEIQTKKGETNYFSVLIRGGAKGKPVEELYRVRLPGNPIIGEGKPENQNHAIIFTRGEHLQAIDMNQEGYLEDAFKMRNFLQEFAFSDEDVPITILGFREHIFTGSVSSLANYMALQEYAFVTLGQRVLNKPLRMRLHYGHPDVFDKLFFMQNGGISKASKGINLSEDIFAGYNNVLRGGNVEFKEYVHVGKGRDVGMEQICKFEAKLSQGAAEQSISRDVYRMVNRLDFFRLLTFYFGGIGHYISSVLTVAGIWTMVYLMLGLALFQDEKIGERPLIPGGVAQFVTAGVGILQTVPLFCTLVVEQGLLAAVKEILWVFVTGGPLYFIFHIRTRDYYFSHTILAGGASYKGTGRGFIIHHGPFDANFRSYAASHFYFALEILVALVLLAFYSEATQFVGRTWSLWLAAWAFLFAPFWFNPLAFDWRRVVEDHTQWSTWMGTTGGSSGHSWDTWWKEETAYVKSLNLPARLYMVTRSSIYVMVALGLLYKPLMVDEKLDELKAFLFHVLLLGVLAVLLVHASTIARVGANLRCCNLVNLLSWDYVIRTGLQIGFFFGVIYAAFNTVISYPGSFLPFVLALYYALAFLATVGLVCGFNWVRHLYQVHDYVLGYLIFFILFLNVCLVFPAKIQSYMLYNNTLSQDVPIERLLQKTQNERESGSTPQGERGAKASDSAHRPNIANQISPEEKPGSPRILELGSPLAGATGNKKKGAKNSALKQQQQPQQQQPPVGQQRQPPAQTASAESFEFLQPTSFPTRG